MFFYNFLFYAIFYRNLNCSLICHCLSSNLVMILSRNDLYHYVLIQMVFLRVHVKVG